jgi:copper homeostasis protein
MNKKFILEVVTFTYNGSLNAKLGGADRIELCDNHAEGGTTPSYGLIKQVKENIDIKVYPLIRPRVGNFFYSDAEFEIMLNDIQVCKELKCDGIATGIQTQEGTLDIERMKRLVDKAYPMKVTCNRVFDFSPDPFKSLDGLIDAGCERVLTSGLKNTAMEALDLLTQLVKYAGDKIIVMPGSGVRADNIEQIVKATHASEYHTSARTFINIPVLYNNPDMSDLGKIVELDLEELKKIRSILS